MTFTRPKEVREIARDKLRPFPDHPYRVLDNEDMAELIESILRTGITSPLLVWEQADGTYIIISGHRRTRAGDILSMETLPCLVYAETELDYDTAVEIMVGENSHRTDLLPSEKGKAYRMLLEAAKRQGERRDLTSSQLGTKSRSDAEIAKIAGESRNQIQRYIRITYLHPELAEIVDAGLMAFNTGVELSYLDEHQQLLLIHEMGALRYVPTMRQASKLKSAAKAGKLTDAELHRILTEERLDDRVTFRLRPGTLDTLNETSAGAGTTKSQVLRSLVSTGGAIYVGGEYLDELRELQGNIARAGNLLKLSANRLTDICDNPFIADRDRSAVLRAIDENTRAQTELLKLRKLVNKSLGKLFDELERLNNGNI
jgi:ParB family chromosome partitioning protein